MHNSKLLSLLKTLTLKETKMLKCFVGSTFHNTNGEVTQLMSLLAAYFPEYSDKALEKQKAYEMLFPKSKYNEQKMYFLISFLSRLVEDFLVTQNINAQPLLKETFLLNELQKRKQNKIFETTFHFTQKLQKDFPFRNDEYYHLQYLLNTEADNFFMQRQSRKADESLQKKADNLDLFYLSAKLKNACEMVNRKNIVNTEYNFQLVEEVKQHIKNNFQHYSDIPAITIYYKILLMLTDSEEGNHYSELVKLLDLHTGLFSTDEQKGMYSYAQNYCIKNINQGKDEYLTELFVLYQKQMENELIFVDNYITQWTYKNIITVGLRVKQYDWVEQFIYQYKNKIEDAFKENAFHYNLANFYYEKKDFRNAIKLLQSVEFTDVYYQLGAKCILLKIYYEQEETESLYSLTEAFKIYLKRNKLVSKYQFKVHINLVKLVKKLALLRFNMPKSKHKIFLNKLEAMKTKIEETKDVANINWLLQQIEALRD